MFTREALGRLLLLDGNTILCHLSPPYSPPQVGPHILSSNTPSPPCVHSSSPTSPNITSSTPSPPIIYSRTPSPPPHNLFVNTKLSQYGFWSPPPPRSPIIYSRTPTPPTIQSITPSPPPPHYFFANSQALPVWIVTPHSPIIYSRTTPHTITSSPHRLFTNTKPSQHAFSYPPNTVSNTPSPQYMYSPTPILDTKTLSHPYL